MQFKDIENETDWREIQLMSQIRVAQSLSQAPLESISAPLYGLQKPPHQSDKKKKTARNCPDNGLTTIS